MEGYFLLEDSKWRNTLNCEHWSVAHTNVQSTSRCIVTIDTHHRVSESFGRSTQISTDMDRFRPMPSQVEWRSTLLSIHIYYLSTRTLKSGEWQISVQISAFGTGNTSEVKNDVILIRMYYVINGTVWRAICHAWRHHITFPALTTITICRVGNSAIYIQLQQWNWIYTNAPHHEYINMIRGRFAVPSANKGG